ncbi:hypothetical protein RJ639_002720 [Escallonia herrerae]|uniref:Uncharacterized protein n=1 Tax=Escallonia herrerae TaxID=1293975 RepID=A0AA88W259_9ASTE|nr:hypothetical protein RJ639_002720 [Escallonia herrerae]
MYSSGLSPPPSTSPSRTVASSSYSSPATAKRFRLQCHDSAEFIPDGRRGSVAEPMKSHCRGLDVLLRQLQPLFNGQNHGSSPCMYAEMLESSLEIWYQEARAPRTPRLLAYHGQSRFGSTTGDQVAHEHDRAIELGFMKGGGNPQSVTHARSCNISADALVQLGCGGPVVANATTNGSGFFSVVLNPPPFHLSTVLSSCNLVVNTPLSTRDTALPVVGSLLSPLQLNGSTFIGLVRVTNLIPAGFQLRFYLG